MLLERFMKATFHIGLKLTLYRQLRTCRALDAYLHVTTPLLRRAAEVREGKRGAGGALAGWLAAA